ncbi:ABC1 kinase family protein [Cupriavidus necator]
MNTVPSETGKGPVTILPRPNSMGRAVTIVTAFSGFVLWLARCKLPWARPKQTTGERFADLLQGLGTTFVKLGQHLSLRADLLPEDTLRALERLQDHVSPFSVDVAENIIELAFGRSTEEIFASFDRKPLAAASIAQIHRATLANGHDVIVKIRRPNIRAQVDSDMRLLRRVAHIAQRLAPTLRPLNPVAVVDEIWSNLRREIDLAREARNVRRFADATRDSPTVFVPDVIDGLWTETVLVQEFSHGRRIDEIHGEQGMIVAQSIVDSYVHQLFSIGYFHGDPHPGNLFVMPDLRVCFHDFGIVGHIDRRLRRALAAFATAFVEQNADWVVDAWLDMGLIRQHADRRIFLEVVGDLLRDFADLPLREWSIANALSRLIAAGRSSAVGLPSDLLVFSRTVLLLESTLQRIAPEFSIVEALSQHVRNGKIDITEQESGRSRRLSFELAATIDELPDLMARKLHDRLGKSGLFELTINQDPHFARSLEHLGARIALAIVTLGLYIASTLLIGNPMGPTIAGVPVLAAAGYVLAVRFTYFITRDYRRLN